MKQNSTKTVLSFHIHTTKFFAFKAKNLAFIFLLLTSGFAFGQSAVMKFSNAVLISGAANAVGATYEFKNIRTGSIDARIRVDSLVNGATLVNIDETGTGFNDAFQPLIQTPGGTRTAYAVFTVRFYKNGNPTLMNTVSLTAVDIDGGATLKEFCELNLGAGARASFMGGVPAISVTKLPNLAFRGQNILGVEMNAVDTLSLGNMFTVSNDNISSFTVKYGAATTAPGATARQNSLYMKEFVYPNQITLPVDIISFTTSLNKDKVNISWSVASENELSHYVIQRSNDDHNYEDIAIMFGKGPDQRITYNYVDTIKGKNTGILFYRLKAVDNSGKKKYSRVSIVKMAENKLAAIVTFPNPFHNEIFVTLPTKWQGKAVSMQVFNNSGQKVSEYSVGAAGQTETMMLGSLARGTYIIRAVSLNESYQQMIIKD